MVPVDFWEDCGDGDGTGSSLSMEPDNEMANETPRDNVMAVEFAIKRELAYRLKMEKLQPKPSGDIKIKEASTHSQTPSSSRSGMKRKASTSSVNHFPQSQQTHSCQPLQNQSVNLFYKVCQVSCSSPANFKQHGESSKHKAKLEEFVESPNKIDNAKKPLWCKLCNVPCPCKISFGQHVSGKKHAARVEGIEKAKRSRDKAERETLMLKWDEMEWEMVSCRNGETEENISWRRKDQTIG